MCNSYITGFKEILWKRHGYHIKPNSALLNASKKHKVPSKFKIQWQQSFLPESVLFLQTLSSQHEGQKWFYLKQKQ